MKGLSAQGHPQPRDTFPQISTCPLGLPTDRQADRHSVSHPGGSKSILKHGQCPWPEVRASNKLSVGFRAWSPGLTPSRHPQEPGSAVPRATLPLTPFPGTLRGWDGGGGLPGRRPVVS